LAVSKGKGGLLIGSASKGTNQGAEADEWTKEAMTHAIYRLEEERSGSAIYGFKRHKSTLAK
jgi:hypothetical protein